MNPSQVLLAAASKGTEAGNNSVQIGIYMTFVAGGGVLLLLGAIKGGGSWKLRLFEFACAIAAFAGVGLMAVPFFK